MHPTWGLTCFPEGQARMEQMRLLREAGWLDYIDAFTLLGTSATEPQAITIANPVYKLWLIKNTALTAQASRRPKGLEALIWAKHDALNQEFGGQNLLYCESAWCNEAFLGFGISAYPSVEANMKLMAGLNELGWPEYLDVISYLGVPARD
jgi:hypothetical protein